MAAAPPAVDTKAIRTELERKRRRHAALETEREPLLQHYEELSDFLFPRAGVFRTTDRNRGQKRIGEILNNTATRGVRTTGAGLMANATSPARPWFRFGVSDPELNRYQPVRLWLDIAQRVVMQVLAKGNSYRALHSMYEELVVFGTAASFVMPDFQRVIHHYPMTAGTYCIAQDALGHVDTIYRSMQMTVGQLLRQFGADNCSKQVRELGRNGQTDDWIDVVHAVEPRDERDLRKLDSRHMLWSSCYFEASGESKGYLRESGFNRFPAIVPRWSLIGNDVYGSSPGMEVLGDTRGLQLKELRKAQAIDYMTAPPLQLPTESKGRELDITPSGQNYVDQSSPSGGIRPLWQVNLDINAIDADIQRTEQRINASLYADLFRVMSMLNDSTQRTRAEVIARHEETLLMLGPTIERLHNEGLEPLIDQAFEEALRGGLLPPPPEELSGQDLGIEFISVLAQAQKAVGTNMIDRVIGVITAVAPLRNDVVDKLDTDALVDSYADLLGVDPRLIVPGNKVVLLREARAKAMAAKEQAELMAAQAGAARDLAASPTGGERNALVDVMSGLTGYSTPAEVRS